jgi:lysozyme
MTVEEIQTKLKALGYYTGKIDGDFGPKSEAAVKAFQKDHGLVIDGKVGPITTKALQGAQSDPAAPAEPGGRMTLDLDGMVELVSHEAIVPMPYKDSVGVWTYGVGLTKASGLVNPASMPKGVAQPLEDVLKLFKKGLEKYEADVRAAVKVPLSQTQYNALVSFHWNTGRIKTASITKLLNAGDVEGAGKAFANFFKPAAVKERRLKEQKLFREGVYSNDGKVSVYPASSTGAVQWKKGKRISIKDYLTNEV